MAYREKADVSIPVDENELEAIRIRETEQTKRDAAQMKKELVIDRRERLSRFFGYDGVVAAFGISFVLCVAGAIAIAIMGAHAHWHH
jgi:hypothetical protein